MVKRLIRVKHADGPRSFPSGIGGGPKGLRNAATQDGVNGPVKTTRIYGERTGITWLDWYNSLSKPSWTPAPGTIGLIRQILYPIILVSFGFVFVQAIRKKVSWLVALPFAINLVANLIFTPIQFGMRNLPLAADKP